MWLADAGTDAETVRDVTDDIVRDALTVAAGLPPPPPVAAAAARERGADTKAAEAAARAEPGAELSRREWGEAVRLALGVVLEARS